MQTSSAEEGATQLLRVDIGDLKKTTLKNAIVIASDVSAMSNAVSNRLVLAEAVSVANGYSAITFSVFDIESGRRLSSHRSFRGKFPAEPVFTEQGELLESQTADTDQILVQTNGFNDPIRIKYLPDGSYLVLLLSSESIKLLKFDAQGTAIFKTIVTPKIEGSGKPVFNRVGTLETSKSGDIFAVVDLEKKEQAAMNTFYSQNFQRKAEITPLFNRFNAEGTLLSSQLIELGEGSAKVLSIDVQEKRIAVAGWYSKQAHGIHKPFAATYEVNATNPLNQQSLIPLDFSPKNSDEATSIMMLPDQSLLIGGWEDFAQFSSGSVFQAGDAFLSILDAQGNHIGHKKFGGNRKDAVLYLRKNTAGEIFALTKEDAPLTHDEDKSSRYVFYRIQKK